MTRGDQEDVTQQVIAVGQARERLADAVQRLADAARTEGLSDVVAECDALGRVLRSRAKRPPVVDATDLVGALSAADRPAGADYAPDFDLVRAEFRAAEQHLDHAVYDLSTARGAHG